MRDKASKASLWNMVEAEHREFVTLVRGLTADQWAAPSLCGAWSATSSSTPRVIFTTNHRYGGSRSSWPAQDSRSMWQSDGMSSGTGTWTTTPWLPGLAHRSR